MVAVSPGQLHVRTVPAFAKCVFQEGAACEDNVCITALHGMGTGAACDGHALLSSALCTCQVLVGWMTVPIVTLR
jgi:hypothetical protein